MFVMRPSSVVEFICSKLASSQNWKKEKEIKFENILISS